MADAGSTRMARRRGLMAEIDWKHAPLPKGALSDDLRLTWTEAGVLADIADGISVADVDSRLAEDGESVVEMLVKIWTKWWALKEAGERLAAEQRRKKRS